jgi:hypothetical protein
MLAPRGGARALWSRLDESMVVHLSLRGVALPHDLGDLDLHTRDERVLVQEVVGQVQSVALQGGGLDTEWGWGG